MSKKRSSANIGNVSASRLSSLASANPPTPQPKAKGIYGVKRDVVAAINKISQALDQRLGVLIARFHNGGMHLEKFALSFMSQLRIGTLAVKALAVGGMRFAGSVIGVDLLQHINYFRGFINRIGNQAFKALSPMLNERTALNPENVDWTKVMNDKMLMKHLSIIRRTNPALYGHLQKDPVKVLGLANPRVIDYLVVGLMTGNLLIGKYQKAPVLHKIIGNGVYQTNKNIGSMYASSVYASFWQGARSSALQKMQSIGSYTGGSTRKPPPIIFSGGVNVSPQLPPPPVSVSTPSNINDPMDSDDPQSDLSIVPVNTPSPDTELETVTSTSDIQPDSGQDSFTEPEDEEEQEAAKENGNDCFEEMRVLEGGSEDAPSVTDDRNCGGCIAASGHWAPLGSLPALNTLECRTRCRCSFVFRPCPNNISSGGDKVRAPLPEAASINSGGEISTQEDRRMQRLDGVFDSYYALGESTADETDQSYSTDEEMNTLDRMRESDIEGATLAPPSQDVTNEDSTDDYDTDLDDEPDVKETPQLDLDADEDQGYEAEEELEEIEYDGDEAVKQITDGTSETSDPSFTPPTTGTAGQGMSESPSETGRNTGTVNKAPTNNEDDGPSGTLAIEAPDVIPSEDLEILSEDPLVSEHLSEIVDDQEVGEDASEQRGDEDVIDNATEFDDGIFEQVEGDSAIFAEELTSSSVVDVSQDSAIGKTQKEEDRPTRQSRGGNI
jgi:hypothetical protein